MARKKVREHDAKKLLKAHLQRLAGLDLPIQVAQVTSSTDFAELLQSNPWLTTSKLVVKPDMLFGQRGKHDLVGLNLTIDQAQSFIAQRMNKEITINNCTGPVTTFVMEPFVPHEHEFYLSIQTGRLGDEIYFSESGGIHVEENWDKVKTISVPAGTAVTASTVAALISSLPLEIKPVLEKFIVGCYAFFSDLDCTLLEMNPFTLVGDTAFPLDARLELDDTAKFRSGNKWGDVEFPLPFGRSLSSAEEDVLQLDEATGASLKLTILNPTGRVWLMVAGGGASVIYADTVGDLGYAQELGNYGEYSGAPNMHETYLYAKTLLSCATANPDGRGRALLIGGAIANFTDVAATFRGIITAIKEKTEAMKACNMRVYVRRGGPNYEKGLAAMRALGVETGIPVEVYGPEARMTGVCKEAIKYVKSFDDRVAA
jgi:ATP citrate (pro-S)-lyase